MKQLFVIVFIFMALGLAGCSLAEDVTPPPGSQQTFAQATQTAPAGPMYPLVVPEAGGGEALYREKCAPCHGDWGLGDGPQANELPNAVAPIGSPDLARQKTPAEWYDIVTRGKMDRFMPPFSSLSERQRWDVIAYVYSLSTTSEEMALGEEIYQSACASCHGEDGRGQGTSAADLPENMINFTDQETMAQRSSLGMFTAITEGIHPDMPGNSSLSEDETWAVVTFLRGMTFSLTPEALAAHGQVEQPRQPTPAATSEITSTVTVSETENLGAVTGLLLNGSSQAPLAGQEVTLHVFEGMSLVVTGTVTTSAEGIFTFEKVEMLPNRLFLASTNYGGATYTSDIGTVLPGTEDVQLNITAFETTTDTSVLSVSRLHIFFDFTDPELMQVVELYIISNPSNLAVVPEEEKGAVVEFDLPDGATNLQFQDGVLGERFVRTENGFADTLPVRPSLGEYQVLFAFDLPYDRKLDLRQKMLLPVEAVVLMMPDSGIRIKSEMLQEAAKRDVEGTTYRMFNGSALAAGSDLAVNISGQPRAGGSVLDLGTSRNSLIIGLGAFGLVLIVTGLWLWRRGQDSSEDEIDYDEEDEMLVDEDPDALMDAIIALDDLYQQGKLPEEAYAQRRAELKARLQEHLGPSVE